VYVTHPPFPFFLGIAMLPFPIFLDLIAALASLGVFRRDDAVASRYNGRVHA
jgi:hypothetical protein